jgi:hypothetical protein
LGGEDPPPTAAPTPTLSLDPAAPPSVLCGVGVDEMDEGGGGRVEEDEEEAEAEEAELEEEEEEGGRATPGGVRWPGDGAAMGFGGGAGGSDDGVEMGDGCGERIGAG